MSSLCLMAKKWKAYSWTAEPEEKPTAEQQQPQQPPQPPYKNQPILHEVAAEEEEVEEDDEEIDVVTVNQSTETKPIIQYRSSHVEESNSVVIGHHGPLPPQNYYQTSAEDYPNSMNDMDVEQQMLTNVSSVIQQHTSLPTPQIRHTSVIHHSASFLAQNEEMNGFEQNNQSAIHHSASPMQPQSSWGPSSPTEGATAPSPPPHIQHSSESEVTAVHYNGYSSTADISHYSAYLPGESATVTSPSYVTLQSPTESRPPPRTRSLAMCFTSTGAALSLPPKKKDIYRPYSLDDRPSVRWRPPEDLTAAHAILDLSASPPAPLSLQQRSCSPTNAGGPTSPPQTKTIAYTYEAFFVSDGRSKKKPIPAPDNVPVATTGDQRPKYTCSECGKQYATSSNLSRHKQTHRSLDSQSAKKCVTCGKAYVSMPALAMHLLTHKLNHACGICGKLFSRPWLLQGHLRSHTGEKPYGCAHCGKAFADRSNLRAHMQTHSTDKNFECIRCHKTFALKSYLNKHLESACVGETDCNTAISNQVPTITHLQ